MKKYICYGQHMLSKRDGSIFFVSANDVRKLYNVPLHECIMVNREEDRRGLNTEGLIGLYPRYDGNYTL